LYEASQALRRHSGDWRRKTYIQGGYARTHMQCSPSITGFLITKAFFVRLPRTCLYILDVNNNVAFVIIPNNHIERIR
jgi:hypothetical protein